MRLQRDGVRARLPPIRSAPEVRRPNRAGAEPQRRPKQGSFGKYARRLALGSRSSLRSRATCSDPEEEGRRLRYRRRSAKEPALGAKKARRAPCTLRDNLGSSDLSASSPRRGMNTTSVAGRGALGGPTGRRQSNADDTPWSRSWVCFAPYDHEVTDDVKRAKEVSSPPELSLRENTIHELTDMPLRAWCLERPSWREFCRIRPRHR